MLAHALRRLARSYGVLTSYRNVDNEIVEAVPDVLVLVLQTLGAPVGGLEDVDDALRARRLALYRQILEPVTILWDGGVDGARVTLPASLTSKSLRATLHLENGDVHDWSPSARTVLRQREVEGTVYLQTRLPLPSLPHGYHRLSLSVDGLEAESLLVRAPLHSYRAPDRPRQWGLFAPVYALHSDSSQGIGNFTDLGTLMDFVTRHGGAFVSTLPFLASFPGEASPYSPMSRLFWNELFIDTEEPGTSPKRSALLDYSRLYREQRERLQRKASDAYQEQPELFRSYQEGFPLALDYARFRAALDEHEANWTHWPGSLRDGLIEEGDVDERNVRYHLYCQAAAAEQIAQLREHDASLYLDLPLGVHRDGYDTWREQTLFAHEVDVGAPPDAAFPSGQNWSFPPVLPERTRAQSHRYLRLAYRHAMRYADILRIDHVMGLHRQFWIPRGASLADGIYIRYPADELYAILNVESHRAECELVGENLGIVPEVVNEKLARHGMRSLYVMQLTPNAPISSDAVASLNTHDTDLFAGARREDPDLEGALRRSLSALMDSPAALVSVTLEDLWLETERQNVPGTTDEHPNWRRPLRYSMEDLEARVGDVLDTFER